VSGHDCAACGPTGRRDFLRVAALLFATLAGLGSSAAAAESLPVRTARGLRGRRDEVTYPLPAADGVEIDKAQQVILVRYERAIYAFALSCPHQNTALKWLEGDARFQCPKHKSKYQPDGTFISGRATRGMDRYAIRRAGESVVVNLDQLYEQDADAAGWAAAKIVLE
jgi:nitrite reductase/ring-hydroxylating ferredoxin subunit